MTETTIPDPHAPLRGLRVLEWSRSIAAAYAARLLADAGAVVAKVEPPEGDPVRRVGPFPHDQPHPERSGLHAYLNRGKRSVVLDTDAAAGHDALRRLTAAADVLVHDQVALAESVLGLSAQELRAASPRLVVTSVTPFGERGPRARWRADDLIVVASSDLAFATPGIPDYVQDPEAEPPLRPDANVGEYVGGLMGAVGTMVALLDRDRSGAGDHVEVAQQEALAGMLNWDLAMYSYGDIILGRYPARMLHAPNHYMPIADGWAVIVAFLDAHWQALVDLMGTPEWASDPRFATGAGRGGHWDELEALLLGWLLDQPGRRLLEQCQGRGIPCAPALSVPEAVDSPQVAARQFLVPSGLPGDEHGRLPGDVVVVNRARRPAAVGAPALDADSAAVVAEWLAGPAGASAPARSPGRVALGDLVARGEEARHDEASAPPLAGLRVVDFGQIVAIPLAGQWLAFLGAEVILIESRGRLPSRNFAPYAGGEPSPDTCGIFNHINRSKRACTLNVRTPEGVELAKRLIATADIVIENFSPGTMEKLGLGYDTLRAVKPDLIMVSLSACGSTGPWRGFSALHSGVISLSGLAAVTGYAGGHPRIVGSILPDPIAASYCVLATLQALYRRSRTGQGQYIEVAMTETLQSFMAEHILAYTMLGREPQRIGNRHRQKAPHGIYRGLGEDRWVAISVASEDEWAALCRVVGRPDLAADPRFADAAARRAHADALDGQITAWTRTLPPEEAASRLQAAGVAATLVYNARDVLADAHMRERGFIVADEHPKAGRRPMPGRPWHFARVALPPLRHTPLLGQDNDYVFRELLGLPAHEVRRLEEARVIY